MCLIWGAKNILPFSFFFFLHFHNFILLYTGDRTALAKKENETKLQQTVTVAKIDSSRGFKSSITSRMSSAAIPSSNAKKSFGNTKNISSNFSKQKLAQRTKTAFNKPVTTQNGTDKKKLKNQTVVEQDVKPIFIKPEMAEISMNARGVELSNMGNHMHQSYTLFVGNLPYSINKFQLENHFRKTGNCLCHLYLILAYRSATRTFQLALRGYSVASLPRALRFALTKRFKKKSVSQST